MKNQYIPIQMQNFSKNWKSLVGILLLSIILFNKSQAQVSQAQVCNYKTGTVTLQLSGQSTGANFSSQLVLTDANGIIKYVSAVNNMTITNVASGNYQAIAVTYNNTVSPTPNLVVNADLNTVNSCNKTTANSVNVCDCNNATGIFNVSLAGKTNLSGQVNKYILTDGKGKILAISDVPNFNGFGNGVYNVYGVSYLSTINNLVVGGLITAVKGDCAEITNGIGYVVCVPELTIDKKGPSVVDKGANFNYTLTVTNKGTAPTSGTTIIKDTLATGISFVVGNGTNWVCTSAPIPAPDNRIVVTCNTSVSIASGASAPVNLTVISNVTGNVSNKAYVSGGGSLVTTVSPSVTTTINEPATPNLVINKSGPPTATVGVNFDYTINVSNNGTTGTSNTITVSDNLPAGLTFIKGTGTGAVWNCTNVGQLVTCTSTTQIPVNGSSTITLTVNPTTATSLGSPASNTATVTGGGDPTTTPKPSPPAVTTINPSPKPSLTITKSGPASGTVGNNYDYSISVGNNGNASTSGAITVTDDLASNLQYVSAAGTNWNCSANLQKVTCISNSTLVLAVGSTSVITLTVKPLDNSSGTSIKNTASVTGGGDLTTPLLSKEVSTDINAAPKPNLAITKEATIATGTVNTNYDYKLLVSNNGTSATSGEITVTDNLPTGLKFVSAIGNGWVCTATATAPFTVTCKSSSVINVSATAPLITLTVTPTQAGSFSNVASVIGGGDATNKTSGTVVTTINIPATPNLTTFKEASASPAVVGVNFDYKLKVSNTSTVNTFGQITVTDNLPSSVTYQTYTSTGGWTCSVSGQKVTCTTSTAISANSSNVINITVKPNAVTQAGAPITNTFDVIGGGDPSTTAKVSNQVTTEVVNPAVSDVQITKSGAPTGTVGTNYTYTLRITNQGGASTSGTITVKDNLQQGLTFVSANGSGFTCTFASPTVTCTNNNGTSQIPASQSVDISLVVKPTTNGSYKNTASITTGGITNSSKEISTTVNCPSDINPGVLGF